VAVTIAFVCTGSGQWLAASSMRGGYGIFSSFPGPRLLASALEFLVPVSWWLLIARVIHAERLVGNTQFWLTRPYEWKNLLAAKLLFLLAFLYLPFFIAQCVLLAEAGFHPLSYLPGLFYNLLLITAVLVLPLFALATVTTNFARLTLTLLGVLVCILGIAAISSEVPSANIATPYGNRISVILLLGICAAGIVLQYAARKVTLARLLLTGLLALIAIVALATPDQALMDHAYPPPAAGAIAPAQFSYNPDADRQPSAFVAGGAKEAGIKVPINVSGVADGSVVVFDDIRVAIEAPDGSHWTSVWQPVYKEVFYPGQKFADASFSIPLAVYEKFSAMPLNMDLTLALSQTQAGKVTRISLPARDFFVPDFGVCSPEAGSADRPDESNGITCRSALRLPKFTFVQIGWTTARCNASPVEPAERVQTSAWKGTLDKEPAEFGIAPIMPVSGMVQNYYSAYKEPPHLCPGSSVTFTQYNLARRTQAAIAIQGFRLPALSHGQLQVIANP